MKNCWIEKAKNWSVNQWKEYIRINLEWHKDYECLEDKHMEHAIKFLLAEFYDKVSHEQFKRGILLYCKYNLEDIRYIIGKGDNKEYAYAAQSYCNWLKEVNNERTN